MKSKRFDASGNSQAAIFAPTCMYQKRRFLLASNRGHDSLACYAVSADTGKLEYLRHVPSGGRTPRNFSFSPDNRFVLVGNQDSDIVSVFAFDAEKGELKHISDYNVPTPVCVKFLNA